MQTEAALKSVVNDREITEEDYDFLYEFQKAVLLALQKTGRLNDLQLRHAERKLQEQRKTCASRAARACLSGEDEGGETGL